MKTARIVLAVCGAALLALGGFRLLTELSRPDLLVLGVWLVAAVLLHDVVVAPLTIGAGIALSGIPDRARRYVQGGVVVGALVTVIAIPLVVRQGTQPAVKAILLRSYGSNLAILLGLTAAITILVYVARVVRDAGNHPAEGG